MTSPGQYASQDGSFARSAGGAAGRGIVLIVIAVAIGLVLLAKGFDGADSTLASSPATDEPAAEEPAADEPAADEPADDTGDGEPADEPTDDTTSDTTPAEPDTTNPPGEVKVAAVNATGEPGLAGTATGILDTQGYVTAAKNASTVPTETSAVYYLAGYSEDAKAIASILGIPADLIRPAQSDVISLVANNENVADFHIFVIQGTDRLAG